MSDRNPYEQLGVAEDASFEEIQDARSRLLEELGEDRQRTEAVEMAYDAVLMDRLRLRQEGRIRVPERIRFPEKTAARPVPERAPAPKRQMPDWLQNSLDRPERNEVLWPLTAFGLLGVMALASPTGSPVLQLALAAGVGCGLYFLNRKENRFGRAVLLTAGAFVAGLLLGTLLVAAPQFPAAYREQAIAAVTLVVLWASSCFLR